MQPSSVPRLFCFGLGFSPLAFVDLVGPEGWRIAGTTRGPEKAERLRARGIETFLFDRGRPLGDAATALAGTTHLLTAVPPDADGDPVLDHHAGDIAALMPSLQWVGYLSTTGVYGDHGGAWVDEATQPAPGSERGRRRVAAEEAWRRVCAGRALDLFRLAGIYGPGRSVLDDLRAGTARRVVKPGHLFGRIHRDDIAAAVLAAMAQDPAPGVRVLNLSDDEPAASADVTAEAARLLGLPVPPAVPYEQAVAGMSAMGRSFWAENRRVGSARTQEMLGLRWRHPSYREGLRAILEQERAQGAAQQSDVAGS